MAPRASLTPERVVDVAAAVADREGPAAVTLARIAAEVGVRPPSLYKHVGGLDDLLRRLRIRAISDLGDALAEASVGQAGPAAVRALAAAYREFGRAHPGLLTLTVPETETADEATREAGHRVVDVVVRALSAYEHDDVEVLHATRVLRCALHGFTTLETAGGFGMDLDLDVTFTWMVELLADGLRRPPASAAG